MSETFSLFNPTEKDYQSFDHTFDVCKNIILQAFPEIDIQHIGSSAVHGLLTKGDIDLVVRIASQQDFQKLDRFLQNNFETNHGSDKTEYFSAFCITINDHDVGIQLVLIESEADTFHHFKEALQTNASTRDAYNALKEKHRDAGMEKYREAKNAFIEKTLKEKT